MFFNKNNSDTENKHREKGYSGEDAMRFPPHNSVIAPFTDGDGREYIPRHPADGNALPGNTLPGNALPGAPLFPLEQQRSQNLTEPPQTDITQPDGSHIAANGAVIRRPWSDEPEIKPDYEYTEEQEDLNLLIM